VHSSDVLRKSLGQHRLTSSRQTPKNKESGHRTNTQRVSVILDYSSSTSLRLMPQLLLGRRVSGLQWTRHVHTMSIVCKLTLSKLMELSRMGWSSATTHLFRRSPSRWVARFAANPSCILEVDGVV
jgi:hypothetical protein